MNNEDMINNLNYISGIISYWLEEVEDRLDSDEQRDEMENDFDICQEHINKIIEYLKVVSSSNG